MEARHTAALATLHLITSAYAAHAARPATHESYRCTEASADPARWQEVDTFLRATIDNSLIVITDPFGIQIACLTDEGAGRYLVPRFHPPVSRNFRARAKTPPPFFL